MEIRAKEGMDFPFIKRFLEKRNKQTKNKYTIIKEPCSICLTLSMCINKRQEEILHCPILYSYFYQIAINLDSPSTNECEIVRVDPLGMSFWVQRGAVDYANVDVIHNGELEFQSIRIEFDKGDIE